MKLTTHVDFPISLFPVRIVSSVVLYPTDMLNSIGSANYNSSYVFLDIVMRQFNFPFVPSIEGNKVKILFYKRTYCGKSYVTQEFRIPEINSTNINLIQCMLDNKYNLSTYNNIIYTILSKIFKLHNSNFAIYGRDHNGQMGYLTFQKDNKMPVLHYIGG